LVVVLWALANIAILVFNLHLGPARTLSGWAMQAARALAKCLEFNGALILLPMMRGLLTRLRPTWLGRLAPLDDAIDFHRIVGHTLFALAIAHGASSVLAYSFGHVDDAWVRVFSTPRGATGGILLVVFAVMWVCALSFVRKKRSFELFYFTHLLYFAWFGLAIAHAPSFAFWVGVPILGFLVEQALRLRRRAPASAVVAAEPLRSGVTHLEVARPAGFRFGPGDYAFIRIPKIAKHEWHPFTISSAPERDTLSFHVRSLGNWTSALRARAEEGAPDLVAHVDGPYGTPSAHIFASRFAVLVAGGIGVTPFASVLESIVLREGSSATRLEKAHFIWLNRDQYSFEWFVALLHRLEQTDTKGLLDVHLYMTGARGGATAMGLELARGAAHAAGGTDVVTGLRTVTHFGAPDWDAVFAGIAAQHAPDKVDVYFCGPPALGRKVRAIAGKHKMSFREERF
jgi:predicted ferric reductase